MVLLKRPTALRREKLVTDFNEGLKSFTFLDGDIHRPIICCCCDMIPRSDSFGCWVDIEVFRIWCKKCNMEKAKLSRVYDSSQIIDDYTVNDSRLKDYALSWNSCINEAEDQIFICFDCKKDMESKQDLRKDRNLPPKYSIANGHLIGKTPDVLKGLNTVELSLLSPVRCLCRIWVFYGGCHKKIRGWHTLFKNNVALNVGTLENLEFSGIKGNMMAVLCGPFTTTQQALTKRQITVDPRKVDDGFR